jgi:glycosyltransferase involved in cell wall biosynthesis
MEEKYDISVVIGTYNRSGMLAEALDSVLAQEGAARYEVIVVDNNSTDGTRQVVERYMARGHGGLRYVFEGRQGVSYARNAGVAEARSEVIAFADDDVRVSAGWVAGIKREFDLHPEVDCIGGKVLPQWESAPPAWLTRDHWMPLALQDYGDRRLLIDSGNRLCLVSANLAFRRAVFAEIGPFAPDLQRIKDGIGSMEDAELLERYWRSGRQCLYVPDLIVTTAVPLERMTKEYHRRWHTGHGYFFAIMRSEEMERSTSRLFDVPAHLYKQAFADAAAWLKCLLLGRQSDAFMRETRIRFFLGFFRKRRKDFLAAAHHGAFREVAAFIRSIASRKNYGDAGKEAG